jgi:excisionase family DNA binding protein
MSRKKRPKNTRPDVSPALNYIERLIGKWPLKKSERTCLREAANLLRTLTEPSATRFDPAHHEGYLTPREVADRFKVHPVTVRAWAREGRIQANTTPGGHRRFSIASVEQFAREYQC